MRRCLVTLALFSLSACDTPSSATPADANQAGTSATGSTESSEREGRPKREAAPDSVFAEKDAGPLPPIPQDFVAQVGEAKVPAAKYNELAELQQNRWSERSRAMIPVSEVVQRRTIVGRLVYQEILRQEVKKQGVDYNKRELALREARAKRGLGDWARHLAWRGESDATLREAYIAELREEALLEKRGELAVSDAEIQAEYKSVKRTWRSDQPRVRASHIFVPIGDPYWGQKEGQVRREATRTEKKQWEEQAKQAAGEIYAEASSKGADFAELAREYGAGPTAAQGGFLGFFTKDRMATEFNASLFTQKVGKVNQPLRTRDGFHIVRLDGRYPPGTPPMDAVKDRLRQRVYDRKLEAGRLTLHDELLEKYETQDLTAAQ